MRTAPSRHRHHPNEFISPRFAAFGPCAVSQRAAHYNSAALAGQALDIPMAKLTEERFNQPWFGSNNLSGVVHPLSQESNLVAPMPFSLYFRDGGVGTFLPLFFATIDKIRRNMAREANPNSNPNLLNHAMSLAFAVPKPWGWRSHPDPNPNPNPNPGNGGGLSPPNRYRRDTSARFCGSQRPYQTLCSPGSSRAGARRKSTGGLNEYSSAGACDSAACVRWVCQCTVLFYRCYSRAARPRTRIPVSVNTRSLPVSSPLAGFHYGGHHRTAAKEEDDAKDGAHDRDIPPAEVVHLAVALHARGVDAVDHSPSIDQPSTPRDEEEAYQATEACQEGRWLVLLIGVLAGLIEQAGEVADGGEA